MKKQRCANFIASFIIMYHQSPPPNYPRLAYNVITQRTA